MSVHCASNDDMADVQRAFVNIYPPLIGACGSAYKTREIADQMAGRNRIACIEVVYRAGEGVE